MPFLSEAVSACYMLGLILWDAEKVPWDKKTQILVLGLPLSICATLSKSLTNASLSFLTSVMGS